MQIPSHVEAMREVLSMAGKGHGHQKVEAAASPAPGDDPAVVLDLSPEAQAMVKAAENGLNPAQAARAYLTANPENDFKNFGHLVSSIARGLFDPDAVSEIPEQSAALSEEVLEEVPTEEVVGDEIPTEEVPQSVVADAAAVEEETTEEEGAVEEITTPETTTSTVASELLGDLLETLNGSEEDGETLT